MKWTLTFLVVATLWPTLPALALDSPQTATSAPAPEHRTAPDEIWAVLERQMAAWNRGDLEAFCADYTEDTMFVSPSGLTRGRQQVLERYQRRYPDRAAQGTLTLEPIQLEIHGAQDGEPASAASLVATWTLSYPEQEDKESATGLTLLVFERRAGGWKIVRDASM